MMTRNVGLGFRACIRQTWHMFALVTLFKLLVAVGASAQQHGALHTSLLHALRSSPLHDWFSSSAFEEYWGPSSMFSVVGWLLSLTANSPVSEIWHSDSMGGDVLSMVIQRVSVIAADAVMYVGVAMHASTWSSDTTVEVRSSHAKVTIVTTIALCNPGLLFVDHIRCQYNGFLLGLLLVSVALIRERRDLAASAVFVVLLLLKHTFAYAAPVYVVYVLRHYCFPPRAPTELRIEHQSGAIAKLPQGRRPRVGSVPHHEAQATAAPRQFSLSRFLRLVVMLVVVLGSVLALCSLLPLRNRLGLWELVSLDHFSSACDSTHAVRASNIWAVYGGVDDVLSAGVRVAARAATSALALEPNATTTFAGSQLATTSLYSLLPSINPAVTMTLTLIALVPVLVDIWRVPHPQAFSTALVYGTLSSFVLGWHVEEQSILMAVLPMCLLACDSGADGRLYFFFSCVAHVSMFPLLPQASEGPILVLFTTTYAVLVFTLLDYFHRLQQLERHISPTGVSANFFSIGMDLLGSSSSSSSSSEEQHSRADNGSMLDSEADAPPTAPMVELLDLAKAPGVPALRVEKAYIFGLALMYACTTITHRMVLWQYTSLVLSSAYCAIGVMYCWARALIQHRARLDRIRTYVD